MIRRPCLDCGTLHNNPTPRCPTCTPPPTLKAARRPLTYSQRAARARAVTSWRESHGEWCPGIQPLGIRPHPVAPPNLLTADHLVPVGLGGPEDGELIVRCRRCNSIKSARTIG